MKNKKNDMPSIVDVEDEGNEIERYPVDESIDNPNAGDAVTYEFNGRKYEIITWNELAEYHRVGSQTISEIEDDDYGKGGKVKSTDLLNRLKSGSKITEQEINLIKTRLNSQTKEEGLDELVQWIWDNTPRLSPEQNKKGYDFLMNLWKSPTGKERANNPFGYREQNVLANFSHFELAGLKDNSLYGQRPFYIPVYDVVSKNGNGFQYYYDGKMNIVGAKGGEMGGHKYSSASDFGLYYAMHGAVITGGSYFNRIEGQLGDYDYFSMAMGKGGGVERKLDVSKWDFRRDYKTDKLESLWIKAYDQMPDKRQALKDLEYVKNYYKEGSEFNTFSPVKGVIYYSVFGWDGGYKMYFTTDKNEDLSRSFTDEPTGKYRKPRKVFSINPSDYVNLGVRRGSMARGGRISKEERDQFIEYVNSFYGKQGVHADLFPERVLHGVPDGASKSEIEKAVDKYLKSGFTKDYTWGGGDSLDRERVRDIMLENRAGKKKMGKGGGIRTKYEYEVHEYKNGIKVSTKSYESLDEVGKVQKNYAQVTFEDLEDNYKDGNWTHVIEYRDDEHYNDMYFVPTHKN